MDESQSESVSLKDGVATAENRRLRAAHAALQRRFDEFSAAKERETASLRAAVKELGLTIETLSRQIGVLEEETASAQGHIRLLQKALKTGMADAKETFGDLFAEIDAVTDSRALLIINRLLAQTRISAPPFAERRPAEQPKTESQNEAERTLAAVCRVLGVADRSKLVETVTVVKVTCAKIPAMQETLERICGIVERGEGVGRVCDSQSELIAILERWADSVDSSRQIVQKISAILQIAEERSKGKAFIVDSIRNVIESGVAKPRRGEKSDSAVARFLDEARRVLGFPSEYPENALLPKLNFLLRETSDRRRNRANFSEISETENN